VATLITPCAAVATAPSRPPLVEIPRCGGDEGYARPMLPDGGAVRPGAEFATDRYGPVFLLMTGALGFTTFVDESQLARAIVSLMLVLAFVGSVRASGVTPLRLRLAVISGVALAITVVAAEVSNLESVAVPVTLLVASALGFAAVTLLRRIFEQPVFSVREVVAALTAYIEFAMVFAFAYMSVARIDGGEFFANGIAGQMSDFTYFSVVTITTLGYGDLTPATDLGRSLAMIETLFGQIFLVVLVAFLVGRLGHKREPGGRTQSEEPAH